MQLHKCPKEFCPPLYHLLATEVYDTKNDVAI